jgi:hypothetical protein
MNRVDGQLWHVTLIVSGRPAPLDELGRALRHLCALDPMNLGVRYREDRAELQFWDEGPELRTVADAAAQLWGSRRRDTGLPPWTLVGMEVMQQQTWRERRRDAVFAPGSVAQLP